MTGRRLSGAATVLVLLAAVLGWLFFYSSVFGLDRIDVRGAHGLSVTTVEEVLSIPKGTPLARLNLSAAETALENITGVESASVTRDWPGTLVVRLIERSAVAAVDVDGMTWLVDRFGVLFAQVSALPEGVVRLETNTDGSPDPRAITAAVQVIDALTPEIRAILVQITVPTPSGIELELTEGRTVIWGTSEDSDRKSRILSGLLAGGIVGTIFDVSAPTSAVIR